MRRATKALLLTGIMFATGLAGCDDGLPTPGSLRVSLTTPNTGDAGILFSVMGVGVTDVREVNSSHHVYWRLVSNTEARILVMGNLATGPVVSLEVLDVDRSNASSGIVLQVTDRNNVLRDSFVGYEFSVGQALDQ